MGVEIIVPFEINAVWFRLIINMYFKKSSLFGGGAQALEAPGRCPGLRSVALSEL
jgi:hypothetical protein